MYDPERFAEEAFKHDSRIRYVGVVDDSFHIVLSKMREGVQNVTSVEEERNFVQLMPPIIMDATEKLQTVLGKIDNVTVRYEKVLLVFFRIDKNTVIFSFNPDVSTPFISLLSETMRKLSIYLTR